MIRSGCFSNWLRPIGLTPSSRAWPLTIAERVLRLNTTNLTSDGLDLNIFYTQGTQEQFSLPGLANILLQDLGLDRVGSQGQVGADNQIDFGTGTLNSRDGRIGIPVIWSHSASALLTFLNASQLPASEREEAIERLAFTELYTTTRNNAANSSKK